MDERMPRRTGEDRRMRESLTDFLPHMEAIVESRHISLNGSANGHGANNGEPRRKMKRCVAVLVWEEPDGTERTQVVGDTAESHLDLKGLLHDGLYLLAHEGEEAFRPR